METDCRRLARTKRFVSLTIQPGDFLSQVDSNNRQIGTQKQLYKIENGFILNLIFSLSVGIFFVNTTHKRLCPSGRRRFFCCMQKPPAGKRPAGGSVSPLTLLSSTGRGGCSMRRQPRACRRPGRRSRWARRPVSGPCAGRRFRSRHRPTR